ncbi:hypothetical protein FACS1894204_03810 [Synergistales bacterium]|nr:hypothetical protein FACS1894204_03810 [Synergistales bacterium]
MGLARCSKLYKRAASAVLLAAAFFLTQNSGAAALTIDITPIWLEAHALRGLLAVWEKIPPGASRLDTLSLVAKQLFDGYDARLDGGASNEENAPLVTLTPRDVKEWDVSLIKPTLRGETSLWFERDVKGLTDEVSPLLKELPIEALSWADSALNDRIRQILERRVPGWSFSLVVRVNDALQTLQISFHASQPLVLAVTPNLFSSTLPVMFQSDLAAKLIPGMSPIIGLPVAWIAKHRDDAEKMAREFLEDRNSVSNTRSQVEITFAPAQISQVDALVSSERFSLQIWLAGYAGMKERRPELGVAAGLNTNRWTGVDLEVYNELLIDVGDFGVADRLGFRFPLLRGLLRLGAEVEWPDGDMWYRAWLDANRMKRPYLWWRWSPEHGHNASLGYRLNEHISVEIHYDGRYKNKVGLKGILSL